MTLTKILQLFKPDKTEKYSVDVVNANTDKIEAAIVKEQTVRGNKDTELENAIIALDVKKLQTSIVGSLPSMPVTYDFEDGVARFTIPSISNIKKGVTAVIEDDTSGKYQSVCSTGATGASATIGSDSNVYAEFNFAELTEDATRITVDFDFQFVSNGRMRIALADLETLGQLSNSDIRWNKTGIAVDIFSNSAYAFQVNGTGSARQSFFAAWLHAKLEIDFTAKTTRYTIYSKSNTTDKLSGTVAFRDAGCEKVTGIALYTWLVNDTVYFDNITVTAETANMDNTLYIVPTDTGYDFFVYVEGNPILLGSTEFDALQAKNIIGDLNKYDTVYGDAYVTLLDPLARITEGIYLFTPTNATNYMYIAKTVDDDSLYAGTKLNLTSDNTYVLKLTAVEDDTGFIEVIGVIPHYNLVNYATTPVRVGTWIDGTPIWRIAYDFDFTESQMEEYNMLGTVYAPTPVTALEHFMILSESGFISYGTAYSGADTMLKCQMVGQGCQWQIPENVTLSTDSYCGFRGYIEFIAKTENLVTV